MHGYDEVVADQNNQIIFSVQLLPDLDEISERTIRNYFGPGEQKNVRILPTEVGGRTGYVAVRESIDDLERIYFVKISNGQTMKIYQSPLTQHNFMDSLRIN